MLCTSLSRGLSQKLSTFTMWLVTLLAMLTSFPGPQPSSAEGLLDSIFPRDYLGYGGSYNFRAKRVFTDTSSQCSLCIQTYDPDSCLRCWSSKNAIVPVHALKRSDGDDLPRAMEDEEAEGEGEVMEGGSFAKRSYGCTCCAHSRYLNQYCCNLCRASNKRSNQISITSAAASSDSPRESTQQRWRPIYTSPLFRAYDRRTNWRY